MIHINCICKNLNAALKAIPVGSRVCRAEMHTNLDQKGVAEPQRTLQVLPEGVVQEAGPCDLAVLVLIHDELCGLS